MERTLREDVEELQAREIQILQAGRYEEWLDLFTEDLHYWMPIVPVRNTREETEPDPALLAYFDDTLETLRLRVKRTASKFAWTEIPPSRVRYFIQITALDEGPVSGEVSVRSNMLVYQTRLEMDETFFVGERQDTLRRVDGRWKIAARKVVVDRSVVPGKNLSIFF